MLLSIIWLIAGLESNNMTFRPSALLKCLYAAACAALYPHAALAQTPDDRDRDKPLTIVVGLNPPDQRDREARLLAQHIGKHLPGNHKVVVQNMPGAGSVKAANYLAEMAPKDGWTIGMVARGIFTMPLFGNSEARFDPTKFSFIGSRAPETSITLLWHEVPVNTIEEARKREVVDRKSTRLNSSHIPLSRMPSSA